jgi:hypothetical protein
MMSLIIKEQSSSLSHKDKVLKMVSTIMVGKEKECDINILHHKRGIW